MRLYPGPLENIPLRDLYLNKSLRPSGTPQRPFVYASFITSLDGRISLPDPETKTRKVPQTIANPRDWRLFQELAASADVVVTTGRYIRDLAKGVAQDTLPVINKPEFADLLEWRKTHGLTPQPAVAIVTDTLDLPIPERLLQSKRPFYIAVGATADKAKVDKLEAKNICVIKAGKGRRVEGRALIEALANKGFGNIDMIAGAQLLNTLLIDGVLNRLYLTQAFKILGGHSFDTILKGPTFDPPADFKLRSLCYDPGDGNTPEQQFVVLDHKKSNDS